MPYKTETEFHVDWRRVSLTEWTGMLGMLGGFIGALSIFFHPPGIGILFGILMAMLLGGTCLLLNVILRQELAELKKLGEPTDG